MIDIDKFTKAETAGQASIVRLQADFPEAAAYAVYWNQWDGDTGLALPDEVTGIRLLDVDEFRAKLAADTAWLARLDEMAVQE